MDVHILASVLRDEVGFLTADLRLEAIAKEMGITESCSTRNALARCLAIRLSFSNDRADLLRHPEWD